jgi:hypothetical protein
MIAHHQEKDPMSNRKTFLIVLPIIALVLMSCRIGNINLPTTAVRGDGNVATEERQVSGFDRIALSGAGDITIIQGSEERLTIEAEQNLLPYIITDVVNGELRIRNQDGTNLLPTRGIRYELYVIDLEAITVSGAGNITAEELSSNNLRLEISGAGNMNIKNLDADTLSVRSSGAGNFRLSGTVDTQNVTISGAGGYNAENLRTSQTTISLSGAGGADVWATGTLNVQISGFGNVNYYGNPTVTQNISGAGRVTQRGEQP